MVQPALTEQLVELRERIEWAKERHWSSVELSMRFSVGILARLEELEAAVFMQRRDRCL